MGYFPPCTLGTERSRGGRTCVDVLQGRDQGRSDREEQGRLGTLRRGASRMIAKPSDPDLFCTDAVETSRKTGVGSRKIRLFRFAREFGERLLDLRRKEHCHA
jgi:hypothetical protein